MASTLWAHGPRDAHVRPLRWRTAGYSSTGGLRGAHARPLATGSRADADTQRGVKGTPDHGNRFAITTPSTCHRSLPITLKPNYLQT